MINAMKKPVYKVQVKTEEILTDNIMDIYGFLDKSSHLWKQFQSEDLRKDLLDHGFNRQIVGYELVPVKNIMGYRAIKIVVHYQESRISTWR